MALFRLGGQSRGAEDLNRRQFFFSPPLPQGSLSARSVFSRSLHKAWTGSSTKQLSQKAHSLNASTGPLGLGLYGSVFLKLVHF